MPSCRGFFFLTREARDLLERWALPCLSKTLRLVEKKKNKNRRDRHCFKIKPRRHGYRALKSTRLRSFGRGERLIKTISTTSR
ncbi:unnamed protein product [Ixodes persulcatus]